REDEPADDEDDWRQAERDAGDEAERVIDRRADVAVGGREERRRAEDPLEAVTLTPAPWHGGMLRGRPARHAREDHVWLEEQAALDGDCSAAPQTRQVLMQALGEDHVHAGGRIVGQPSYV